MVIFENVKIEEDIFREFFACNLKKCKGACCTYPGEYGAPVLDEEIEDLHHAFDFASEYLSPQTIKYIEKHGLIAGSHGNFTTVCINHRDCVYVFYEGDIAKCSIERAYFDGKISFRKPISCHLFPIRVSDYGGKYLYYQRIEECNPGKENGLIKNIRLFKSLEEALVRYLGEEWFNKFEEYLKNNGK